MREAGLDGRGRRGRQPPRRSPGGRRTRSGSGRISTPCPRAAASTARSASSPARGGRAGRCRTVVAFRGEEVGCIGSRALVAAGPRCPRRFSSSTSSRGRVLGRARSCRSASSPAIVGYARGELVFEGRAGHAGTTPMEGREDALVEAAEAILRIRDARAGDRRARWPPSVRSTSSRAGATSSRGASGSRVDARAPDASGSTSCRRDRRRAGAADRAGRHERRVPDALRAEIEARGPPGRRARLGRGARRGHPRRGRRADAGCSSSGA